MGTYDSDTRTITYRFTNYITRYEVANFSIISPFFVDRYTVKSTQNIDLYLKIGDKTSQSKVFFINYDPYYGTMDTNNPVNIGSSITRLNQDTGEFVNYIYINPAGQSLEQASLTFTGNGSSIIDSTTEIQIFEVTDSHLQMPSSWGSMKNF